MGVTFYDRRHVQLAYLLICLSTALLLSVLVRPLVLRMEWSKGLLELDSVILLFRFRLITFLPVDPVMVAHETSQCHS